MPVTSAMFGSIAQNGDGTIHSVFQAISRLEGQYHDQARALRSVMRQLDRIVQLMAVMNRYLSRTYYCAIKLIMSSGIPLICLTRPRASGI